MPLLSSILQKFLQFPISFYQGQLPNQQVPSSLSVEVDIVAVLDTAEEAENLEVDFALELLMMDFEHECYYMKYYYQASNLDCRLKTETNICIHCHIKSAHDHPFNTIMMWTLSQQCLVSLPRLIQIFSWLCLQLMNPNSHLLSFIISIIFGQKLSRKTSPSN